MTSLPRLWSYPKGNFTHSPLQTPLTTEFSLCRNQVGFTKLKKLLQCLPHAGLISFFISVELSVQPQPGADFVPFKRLTPGFQNTAVVFFYASADGTGADPFDTPKSYPGGKTVTFEITFDEFPEDVSIRLYSGLEEVWFRPFRYYINEALQTVTESIPIPNESRDYTLSVRDARGDGIGSTSYKILYGGEILVENTFETGGSSGGDFSLDPSEGDPSEGNPSEGNPSEGNPSQGNQGNANTPGVSPTTPAPTIAKTSNPPPKRNSRSRISPSLQPAVGLPPPIID